MSTANGLILKKIIDKPSPEVRTALRRLGNALDRPSSTATNGDVWPRPPKAARSALEDLRSHYTAVRKQIAKAPQVLGDAPQKRQLLDGLDALIDALDAFETALFPRDEFSSGQDRSFGKAKRSSAVARDTLTKAIKAL